MLSSLYRIHIQNNGKVAYVGDDRKWHFLEKFCVAGIENVESFKDVIDGIEVMTSAIQYCLDEPVSRHWILKGCHSKIKITITIDATMFFYTGTQM